MCGISYAVGPTCFEILRDLPPPPPHAEKNGGEERLDNERRGPPGEDIFPGLLDYRDRLSWLGFGDFHTMLYMVGWMDQKLCCLVLLAGNHDSNHSHWAGMRVVIGCSTQEASFYVTYVNPVVPLTIAGFGVKALNRGQGYVHCVEGRQHNEIL